MRTLHGRLAALLVGTLALVGLIADATPATAAVNCYTLARAHPANPGIYQDPCSLSEYYVKDTSGNPYFRLAEAVEFSWVSDGAGGTKINAVRTVARITDVRAPYTAVQVNSINAGYFNGGGLLNTCAECPVNTTADSLAYTPFVFGVGCGNSATGHSAGDEVWNHAVYSYRSAIDGSPVILDEGPLTGGADTRSSPSFYYFAPRSSC